MENGKEQKEYVSWSNCLKKGWQEEDSCFQPSLTFKRAYYLVQLEKEVQIMRKITSKYIYATPKKELKQIYCLTPTCFKCISNCEFKMDQEILTKQHGNRNNGYIIDNLNNSREWTKCEYKKNLWKDTKIGE